MTPQALADLIRQRADDNGKGRFITALAGPPGAGKSTLAAALVGMLGPSARAVPMDGFHFDDAILTARNFELNHVFGGMVGGIANPIYFD